jgi:predicted Zn-dependent protease
MTNVTFFRGDVQNLARALQAVLADPARERIEAFFERQEVVTLSDLDEARGVRVVREEGLAVRWLDDHGHQRLASADGLGIDRLRRSLRRSARQLPSDPLFMAHLEPEPRARPEVAELQELGPRIRAAVDARRVGFPFRVTVERHRRRSRVIGPHLTGEEQSEHFYSCRLDHPWGRFGLLLPDLEDSAVEAVAKRAVADFLAREKAPPDAGRARVVLGPDAAAVLLHEAVAHGLEPDLLSLTGRPEAALGVLLGAPSLNVLDDPGAAPESCRRSFDDEGTPVVRRWLLRQGRVDQLLADQRWARRCEGLMPGAARRANRHEPPVPRSTHLELLPGEASTEALLSELGTGLYASWASRGALDAIGGRFVLEFPFGRRVERGRPGERVGPFRIAGRIADLLTSVIGLGSRSRSSGAGWCAKGGQRLAVWATAPAIAIADVEVLA